MSETDNGLDTLLVGIDAGCLPIIEAEFAEGRLPTLRDLFDDGPFGPLESQIPPWTASAWPSLYTGTNPGKHGVNGFLRYEGYDWDVVNATHVRERSLWELLDERGLSSVVVNVPVTAPPPDIDGAVVPGYTAPESPTCHPPGILDEIEAEIGDYRVYPEQGREQPDEYTNLVRMRGDAFRYLVDREDPEFGFLQFQATDTVFHKRPDDLAAVSAIYEAVDDRIAAVIEATDPDTVVVASDHGMGRYSGAEFRVNEFLRDHGFLETTRGGKGMPAWNWIREDQLREGERKDNTGDPGLLGRVAGAAASVGLTTRRVGKLLESVGLAEHVAPHVPSQLINASAERVDFSASQAYVRSRTELGVRINLRGREPDGVVPQDEYESVRTELIQLLSNVTAPDGRAVFEDVARREAYFEGDEEDRAVDVVTVPAEFDHFLSADFKGKQFGEPPEPWNHKLDGVVSITGDGVSGDHNYETAHLFDIAPTVLATMGLPASDRMDGHVLPGVDPAGTERYASYDPRRPTATDDRAVERWLSDLGYLEGNR